MNAGRKHTHTHSETHFLVLWQHVAIAASCVWDEQKVEISNKLNLTSSNLPRVEVFRSLTITEPSVFVAAAPAESAVETGELSPLTGTL